MSNPIPPFSPDEPWMEEAKKLVPTEHETSVKTRCTECGAFSRSRITPHQCINCGDTKHPPKTCKPFEWADEDWESPLSKMNHFTGDVA